MYQIAFCDDETAELDKVESMITAYGEQQEDWEAAIERFVGAEELLKAVKAKKYQPDLLFMDIYMPEKTGIEVAKELREMGMECRIIFLTTSREHALEAFRVDAAQYLVKPVSEEELFPLVDRVLENLEKEKKKYLLFRIDNSDYRIALQDIVFCEAQKKRQCICMTDGTHYMLGMTMGRLYEMLAEYSVFAKVGVSYIVNMEHIVCMSVHEIEMDNGKKIYPPRGSYQSLREKYFDYYCKED